jgi:hypothetical protein
LACLLTSEALLPLPPLQACQLTQVRRGLLPEPQTLMQFECKEPAD